MTDCKNNIQSDLLDRHLFEQNPELIDDEAEPSGGGLSWEEHINTMENDPKLKEFYRQCWRCGTIVTKLLVTGNFPLILIKEQ